MKVDLFEEGYCTFLVQRYADCELENPFKAELYRINERILFANEIINGTNT